MKFSTVITTLWNIIMYYTGNTLKEPWLKYTTALTPFTHTDTRNTQAHAPQQTVIHNLSIYSVSHSFMHNVLSQVKMGCQIIWIQSTEKAPIYETPINSEYENYW